MPRSFLSERGRKGLRVALAAGLILVLVGLSSALYLVVGLALVALVAWLWVGQARRAWEDRGAARRLAGQLQHGATPATVPPAALQQEGYGIEPGERCFIDGARGEALVWYGSTPVAKHRLFLAWGSPMAWMMSILAMFTVWHFGRRRDKKNAPKWRDAEPVRIWLTDRRFILHRSTGQVPWMQMNFANVTNWWLERDGIAIQVDFSEAPVKLRFGSPAWAFVLANFARGGVIVNPQPR